MDLLRRARRLLIAAALLLFLALVLRASARAPERQTPVDRVVVRVTAPLQGAVGRVLGQVSSGWSHYVALVGVKRDNERLRRENTELAARLASQSQLAARAERLERLLELRSQVLTDTATAQIIGMETSQQFRVLRLRLDRGGAEMRPGMPVLSIAGVVGRIARAVGPFADVQLATDPKSSIDVVLPRTGSRGVLKGVASDTRYLCRIEYLVQKDEVQLGDTVMTSGLGAIFPREIPVGKVVRLRRTDASLYQEVEVEPSVDFGKLREVLVVLSPPPAPDPDQGKRPAESARGLGIPR